MKMLTIELDASGWATVLDFYDAILGALGAPTWHGKSVDALIDSIIFGGINPVEPPNRIRIKGVSRASAEVQAEIKLLEMYLPTARKEYRELRGHDNEVKFEFLP